MGSNPSYNSGCDNCPVDKVSWNEVQQYIQKLNAQTGKNYRLPTEAEWEYAAKGGKASRGYTYSGSNDIDSVAWYYHNSGSKTHAVGTKQANELGIYDMSGNVWEWCSDWYDYYSGYSVTNPTGPTSGYSRVLRGGWKGDTASNCRSAARNRRSPADFFYGFRLVLPVVR
jgi:formylglycine-generating enzyme required for sulfatase activity